MRQSFEPASRHLPVKFFRQEVSIPFAQAGTID